jgi:hypothetical protein
MYTIKNDFHNTQARTRGGRLSVSQERRIKRKLCGSQSCTCGGLIGERGPQTCGIFYEADNRVVIADRDDYIGGHG